MYVLSTSTVFYFFFFSSRRRHTRFDCDWSSDVCSSDLQAFAALDEVLMGQEPVHEHEGGTAHQDGRTYDPARRPAAATEQFLGAHGLQSRQDQREGARGQHDPGAKAEQGVLRALGQALGQHHGHGAQCGRQRGGRASDRKSTRLNSSHSQISYAVFCLKKKKKEAIVGKVSSI